MRSDRLPASPALDRSGPAAAVESRRRSRLRAALLGVAALIHLLPLPGVAGAAALQRLYGVAVDTPDLLLLLQHRAVLFGLLGLLLLGAIRWPTWRAAALLSGIASTASFLALALGAGDLGLELQRVVIADVVALAALLGAAALQRTPGGRVDVPVSS